jgi:hypothetical protein
MISVAFSFRHRASAADSCGRWFFFPLSISEQSHGLLLGFQTQTAFALAVGGYAVISDGGFHVKNFYLCLYPFKGKAIYFQSFTNIFLNLKQQQLWASNLGQNPTNQMVHPTEEDGLLQKPNRNTPA